MTADIILWLIVIVSAILLYLTVDAVMSWRNLSNKFLAVASADFHKAAESLMKSSSELPSSVLDTLSFMNKSAFADGMPKAFLRSMRRQSRRKNTITDSSEGASNFADLESLRPELKTLVGNLAAAWLNILTHRSVLCNFMLSMEIMRIQVNRGSSTQGDGNIALRLAPRMKAAA